jgi:hypothetical protein
MAEKYVMKQHDLEPSFEVQLLDGTTPVDLTSVMAILFLMRSRKGLKAVGPMTVADQSMLDNVGICRYDWVLGDTDTTGTYNVEVQVTWPNARPQTFPANQYITVDIQKDLGPLLRGFGSLVSSDGGDLVGVGLNTTVGLI